jgi:hypothetical protein
MSKARDIFNLIIAFCLFLASVLVLGISSVTTIYYDMHYDEDWPQYGKENIPLLLILVILVLAAFLFLYKKNKFEDKSRLFMAIGLVFVTCYCLMLILSIKPQAVNDSKTLDNIINSFMKGDYSELTQKGGYLFIWPFQLGYVALGQFMGAVFGPSNYFAWDILQLLCILVTVFLIYRITWELFGDRTVCGIVGLLSVGALFFYNYVTYIYGDIISMAPQTLALYMMILYIKRKKPGYAIVSGISIAAAVVVKTNCEITLIALVMILLGSIISDNPGVNDNKRKLLLERILLAVFFIGVTFLFKGLVNIYYCNLTGLEAIPDGNPSLAHIAMGLQESPLEDGWYNGYNYDVFEENDYDTAATKAAALENIKETLATFVDRPLHGARFLLRKFSTQWADSVCISTHNLDLVSRHVDNPTKLGMWLVFGTGSKVLIWVMNVFMPICYIGVLAFLFGILKGRRVRTEEMLLLILIFGGIVFHEFWEGSSRYTMRYYIYWLPYSACGLKVLLGRIAEYKKRKI